MSAIFLALTEGADFLDTMGVIVAVVGLFKAIEWVINKITSRYDKERKIDQNDENFQAYKTKTDKEIQDLQKQVNEAHSFAVNALNKLEKSLVDTLNEHREDYIKSIKNIEDSITEMQGTYQQTVAIVELKIENLEKSNTKHLEQLKEAQNKHNNLMERTFLLEKNSAVHDQMIKVANHRIDDIEKRENK